ncbi:hypothetical protein C3F09_08610 [candidate division GN15 bacterium]|uniref:Uncharacterized protein n=1 Tax=candidate division GN15 bacterium TaxID=2072418 RepID=A0A855X5M0_9BACT|nr:MAG: hypothetical protein C3F09_08610 [candidate division GN15 bacterium]
MTIWQRLSSIDRHYIYLLVAAAVIFPLIVPAHFPIGISPEARQLYDAVDSLPEGSVVLLTFDMYANNLAETEPIARAALYHLFKKNLKVVTVTTIPFGGPSVAERITRELAAEFHKTYGVDYVNLGYKPNYVSVLKGMGSSIESIYPTDNSGTPLSQLPLMQKVRNYSDMKFIFVVADNGIVDYWISIVQAQYGIRVGCGVTSVMAPKLYAYVGSGQMTGLLGGMKGAAEYEQLVGKPAMAVTGMGIQSLVHLLIIALIVIGNLGYFMEKRRLAKVKS